MKVYSVSVISPRYFCANRAQGVKACRERSYGVAVADAAVLAELRKLRGKPWTVRVERQIVNGHSKEAERLAQLARELEAEREKLRRHTRLMALVVEDPTPEQIATFREVSAEISTRIRALAAQTAEARPAVNRLPALRAIHQRITQTELADVEDRALPDQVTELRELVQTFTVSARIVDHNEGGCVRWARAEVAWSDDVKLLLGKVLYLHD